MSSLLFEVVDDLVIQDILVQAVAILLCLGLAMGLSRGLRKSLGPGSEHPTVLQLGVQSFFRILTPVLVFFLLLLARWILVKLHAPAALVRSAIPLSISLAGIRFVFYLLRRIFTDDSATGVMLRFCEKTIALLVWVGVALYLTGLWPELLAFLDETVLPFGRYKASLLEVLQASVSVSVTLLIALWCGALLEDRLNRVSHIHTSLRTVVARLARACLVLLAILISLSLLGIDLTVLSVFGGALGVGLGLGLQKIASSYVSGFVILLERSMSIGDMVNVDRYFGKVTQINTRYTILEGLDGIESVLPNDIFMTTAVQNYSLTHRILRLHTQLTILYQDDIEGVLLLLESAALSVERVSQSVLPQALLIKIGPDGLELELGFWITDPENGRLNVLSDVNRAIWRTLQAEGIQIAHPKRDVRVMDPRSFDQMPSVTQGNSSKER
ncbi:mechanosensitive ion channel family protein [Herbaspirillum sp. RTI4]|uniref:mechanosensitive ion channel family protein n=1 Tax=Herbaspirillum sp. RTI4 TaxID=3048640 RepID=UPI003A0FF9C2